MEKPRHRMQSSNPLKRYIADPGSMGLFAFAGVTLCASFVHTHWLGDVDVGLFAPAICYGGLVQVLAGLIDLIRGEKVSGGTFVAFGFYWTTQGVWMMRSSELKDAYPEPEEFRQLKGSFILAFAFIALSTLLAELQSSIAQIILLSLVTFDFTSLAIISLTYNRTYEIFVGYVLLITAALAWYIGTSFLLRDISRIKLPLGYLKGNDCEEETNP